jgi:hypothetical protein
MQKISFSLNFEYKSVGYYLESLPQHLFNPF